MYLENKKQDKMNIVKQRTHIRGFEIIIIYRVFTNKVTLQRKKKVYDNSLTLYGGGTQTVGKKKKKTLLEILEIYAIGK